MKKSNLAIIGLAVIVISIVVISSPKDTKLDPDSEYVYHNMGKMELMKNYLKLVMRIAKDSVTTTLGLYQMVIALKH